jgi:hypothetical protein
MKLSGNTVLIRRAEITDQIKLSMGKGMKHGTSRL